MKKATSLNFILISFITAFLFSCTPQKKAVTSTKNEMAAVDKRLIDQGNILDSLEEKGKNKQELNQIDDTAGYRFRQFIGNTQKEIIKLIDQNKVLIGESVVNKDDWEKLKKAISLSQESLKRITYKVSFLNDLISRNTVVKLEQDVLFESPIYSHRKSSQDHRKFF